MPYNSIDDLPKAQTDNTTITRKKRSSRRSTTHTRNMVVMSLVRSPRRMQQRNVLGNVQVLAERYRQNNGASCRY